MALRDLLKTVSRKSHKKVEVDKKKIRANLSSYQKLISYWRIS